MIPNENGDLRHNFRFVTLPSRTFKINYNSDTITGFVDELEAIKQAVYLMLNTERYQYIMYSWNYGVELVDLIGKPVPFVLPEIKRRVREALLQDKRITDVTDFDFTVNKGVVAVRFKVESIFGGMEIEKAVSI